MTAMARHLERPPSGTRHARALEEARKASMGRNWQKAYDLLTDAGVAGLDAEGLALLADAAYACGHPETTIAAWERAYGIAMKSGDRMAAAGAAVKVALHLLMDTGLMAPVRGWTRRVQTLLEGAEETPVQAWLAVVCNYERMLSGDYEEARRWARTAIDIGTRCAPAAAVNAAHGLVLMPVFHRHRPLFSQVVLPKRLKGTYHLAVDDSRRDGVQFAGEGCKRRVIQHGETPRHVTL